MEKSEKKVKKQWIITKQNKLNFFREVPSRGVINYSYMKTKTDQERGEIRESSRFIFIKT